MAAPNTHPSDRHSSEHHFYKKSPHNKRTKIKRLIRYIYIRFVRLRSHPRAIARGLAAGVFAGSYPLFGLQTIIGIAIAVGIRGNKIVAAAGTWISNPFTYVPIYAFNYQVGRWILGQSTENNLTQRSPQEWMSLGFDITVALMVGSTLVGLILAILSYYVGLYFAYNLKSKRN
ncbi:MAG: DUF2062 domain-containing protein [Leptolyngbya sp. SIO3F4]|nr:DUF2062 domain-containing protein [Leptolyngbya sp. SIO3F4]